MAEGGKNPDEPPLKREKDHGEIEEQERSPDISINVIGSQNSTIGTSNVVGAALDGARVGTTSAGPGRTTEKGDTPDEPPLEKLRTLGLDETMKDSLPGNINITANGPKHSSVTTSTVIGYAESVTVQNDGKGEITMKCQHDYQSKLLDSTKEKILIRTRGMIRVSAVDSMIEKLKHGNNWITITGNAGDGKTTLAHFVLKDFADNMNVYVIKTPEEYDHISQIEEDRVILLNDMFGAFTFDSSSVNKWRDVIADIFDIQMNRPKGVTKVVFVSRHNILQEVKVHLEKYGENITDNENGFDLSQMNTGNERLQILKYHLDRKGITEDYWDKESVAKMNTLHGFPHCCEMYVELVSKEQDIDIVDFFETPLKFLDKTTKLLFETGYRELFINLVKRDGEFSTDSVEDDEKKWNLEEQAARQEGSYLANVDGIWVFRHPSIYESVLSVVAQKDPLLLVKHASISVIMQKVRFRTSRSETPTCYILLDPRPRVLDALAERFLQQLKEGDYCIFELTIGRNEDFIGRLINKLSSLEQSSSNFINKKDWRGDTMLYYAVLNYNYPAVRALLAHGADPDICGFFGMTCLTIVCDTQFSRQSSVNMDILSLLITYKANVNHIDQQGRTPFHCLCRSKEVSVEALQLLLNSGADINHIDSEGRTPLHYLCEHKEVSVEALQLLLNSEADINHIDSEGRTPLHHLCANKEVNVEALQILFNSEANVNQCDKSGFTPLHALCQNQNTSVESVLLLIRMGAGVNNVDKQGQTPLHVFCTIYNELFVYFCFDIYDQCLERVSHYQTVIDTLIRNGSDVNKSDNAGNTPLHSLCDIRYITDHDMERTYFPFALKTLLKGGADVNLQNQKGEIPVQMLRQNYPDYTEAIKLLTN